MSNKFWKGLLLGAIAGGALSLFDTSTRKTVLNKCNKATKKVTYYATHPQNAVRCVKDSTNKIRSTIKEVGEEVAFISEKMEELKDMTPRVADLVKDTKKTFTNTDKNEFY